MHFSLAMVDIEPIVNYFLRESAQDPVPAPMYAPKCDDYTRKVFNLLNQVRTIAGRHQLGIPFAEHLVEMYARICWNYQGGLVNSGTLLCVPIGDLLVDLGELMKIVETDEDILAAVFQLLKVIRVKHNIVDVADAIVKMIDPSRMGYQIMFRVMYMKSLKHMTDSTRTADFVKFWPEFNGRQNSHTEHILKIVGDIVEVRDDCTIQDANAIYDAVVGVHQTLFS